MKCTKCGTRAYKYFPNFAKTGPKRGFTWECSGCGYPMKDCVCTREKIVSPKVTQEKTT